MTHLQQLTIEEIQEQINWAKVQIEENGPNLTKYTMQLNSYVKVRQERIKELRRDNRALS